MYPYQFELWEAINDYAESCGGDTSDATARRPGRMKAVVAVEEIIEKLRFTSQPCVQDGQANPCRCNSEARVQCAFWDGEGGCVHPPAA